MRKYDFPYLADWFAISFRWLVLLGLTVSLVLGGALHLWLAVVLLFAVMWNTFVSVLTALNQRLPQHRLINALVDGLVSLTLFALSGGMFGPLAWASLLTVLSTALYFELRGSLLAALLLALLQSGWSLLFGVPGMPPVFLAAPFVFNLLMAALFGLACSSLMKRLREHYRVTVHRKDEVNRLAKVQERERLQAFYSVLETLSATLNYQVVLDAVLDMSSQILGGARTNDMVSAVLLFSGRHLKVESARRLPPRDLKQTFPAEAGVLHAALTSGEPQHLQDPANDPELSQIVILQGSRSALCLPLLRGLDAYGVMLYAHPEAEFFDDERVEMLEMLSHQAVIAIQNARLFQQLQEEKEVLLQTQEITRKHLARDLHDGPTQSVSSIAMRINIVRKMLELERFDELMPELESIEDLARRTTQEIRHMLFTLRPLVLESQGLTAALEAMAGKMHETYQQNVKVSVDEAVVSKLDISKQTVIFYIAEEAVNNARKHAQASLIQVRLRFLPDEVNSVAALEIVDNGVGFNVDEVTSSYEQRGSLGMVNLQERSELINGLLRVESLPSKGTRVRVLIPLTEEATDRLVRGLITVS
jgi:signal transduction histidine kinase